MISGSQFVSESYCKMKRVLWLEIFVIVTFAVRASKYPSSGWPPPPTRYFQRSRQSHRNHSNYRHSEWKRVRRRQKPHHFSDYHSHQHNDDGHRRHQKPNYQEDYEDSDQYLSHPNNDFQPNNMRQSHTVNDTRQRHRTIRKGDEYQRRRVNRNNQRQDFSYAWQRDNNKFPKGLSMLRDKLDDGRHAGVNPTTQEPLHISDVKVPTQFLRIEYMISFSFLGLMYGLGFLVMFQSLCVTTAKITVYLVYYALLRTGVVRPPSIQDALEQMPPL